MNMNKSFISWDNSSSLQVDGQEPRYVICLKTLAYVGVFLASLTGNSLVILAYKYNFNRKLRTVSNTFIVSMAVADLCITIGSIPERITRVLANDQWLLPGILGVIACKIVNFIEKLSLNVSVLHLASIAIDRFLVVFYPRRKIITHSISKRIVASIWLLSIGYCIPILVYGQIANGKYCKVRVFFTNWRVWYIVFLIILFGTFILIVLLYTAIAVKLWRKRTPGVRLSFRSRRTEKLNLRIMKMVAIIVAVFYICFLPYWIGWIFCSYHFTGIICSKNFVYVAIFLSYLNSALNPIIYTIFNENFRFAFRMLAQKLCCFSVGGVCLSSRAKDGFVIGPKLDSNLATDVQVRFAKPSRSLDFLGTNI